MFTVDLKRLCNAKHYMVMPTLLGDVVTSKLCAKIIYSVISFNQIVKQRFLKAFMNMDYLTKMFLF